MVDKAIAILNSNRDINEFGQLLDKTWQIKRKLTSKISNPSIDKIYEKALSAGATGGKLLGAGGGGCVLFVVPTEKRNAVREATLSMAQKNNLSDSGEIPVRFVQSGAEILMNHG